MFKILLLLTAFLVSLEDSNRILQKVKDMFNM
jgi:hypothetical protein